MLFERFLSEERGEWPDIDLDLPSGDQREKAIQYVYERYGKLGAAMTANVITYRGRSAAREVGKSLGFDEETLGRLSGLVNSWEYKDPGDTLERQFRDAGFDLRHPRIRKFFELCLAIQDLPRHLGQHSGGMVICQGQLDSIVPLEPATMPGRVVVQWDKEDCADLGIVKVDLLGLGMMAVLEESITLIRDQYKEDVDLAGLPADDPVVYGTLQKADTVGMFQIESRAQMSCLPRLNPTRFYDIVVQVAIIRPGPIVGQMVNPYLMRRQGRQKVVYPHPSLEPVLERTLGVPLFQEQLLRVAMIAAGFTGGEAEELRRAFGFKRSEKRMKDIEVKLRAGMERNGITGAAQEEILQSITSFALYGFPESHAASFALIAYASAWLKCHYLAAFTAALLNNQPMGFYSPATLVKDAQRHGLKVKPIDVTVSDWACALEEEPKSFTTEARRAQRISDPILKGHAFRRAETISSLSNEPGSASDRCNRANQKPQPLKPDLYGTSYGTPEGVPIQDSPPDEQGTHSRFALRMGLRYARGLREEAAQAIIRERNRSPFTSIADLAYRVPELRRDEMVLLASIGALNAIDDTRAPESACAIEYARRQIKTSSPRCIVAGGTRSTIRRAATRWHSRDRHEISAGADDCRRTPGSRLSWNRTHGWPASTFLSSGRPAPRAHSLSAGPDATPGWPARAHRRMRHCAATPRHSQGLRLPQPRGRDRNQQRDHLSRCAGQQSPPHSWGEISAARRHFAKSGRRGFNKSLPRTTASRSLFSGAG